MNTTERKDVLELLKEVAAANAEKQQEHSERLRALEMGNAHNPAAGGPGNTDTVADHVTKSENFKALLAGNGKSCRIDLPAGLLEKAAIVNSGQVLAQAQRLPGMVANPLRTQRIRDLMPVGPCESNAVEFTRENVFTNAAAPQYGSPATENVTKPESGITFTLASVPVVTLAHWIPVSKQVLADQAALQSYINTRLMQGLKVKEDTQLLAGDGTAGAITGILASGNFTAAPSAVSGENNLDRILRAIAALASAEMVANGILLNPSDWADMQLVKDTEGQYLLGSPGSQTAPNLWGVPVVATTAIDAGDFLVGDWQIGAQVWDRQQASVQISYEDGTNFVKNMATILCEERVALTVYRPAAFRMGTF